MELELRSDHDDRTARVVDALSKKVLTETSLLSLEHVRQRLERTVTGSGDRTTASTVVEQRVDRFLQHALFVVLDDLRSHLLVESLQTVVAVDDAAVQVVEVRRRETSTVELNHGTKVGRDHGDHAQHHRLGERNVAGVLTGGDEERVHDTEALDRTDLALSLAVLDFVTKNVRFSLELFAVVLAEVLEHVLDGFGTHECGEVGLVERGLVGVGVSLEVVDEETELRVVGPQATLLERAERIPRALPAGDVIVERLADVRHLALGRFLRLALHICFCLFGFELGEFVFEFFLAVSDFFVAHLFVVANLGLNHLLDRGHVLVHALGVDARHHVGSEVDDLFEVLRGHVKEVTETAGDTLEVPDVGNRSSEFDVTHALTTNGLASYLDTTSLTRDALEADTLVLATGTLPVLGRTKDLFSEETILLGLERAVVDGLRLLHLTARPRTNLFVGGELDANLLKSCCVEHFFLFRISR